MKLQIVPRRGAVADVLARLQAQIAAGDYKPNERLPSESELCKAFGVSRPVLREALMSLQALGLTTSQAASLAPEALVARTTDDVPATIRTLLTELAR